MLTALRPGWNSRNWNELHTRKWKKNNNNNKWTQEWTALSKANSKKDEGVIVELPVYAV